MFPGASADREAAEYAIVGAPLDATTTFQPGTRFGPDRIRRFAETYDDYDRRTDQFFTDLSVHDAGDVHAWSDVPDYLEFLEGTLRDVVWEDAVPLVVGGEHTVTYAGVAAVEPDVLVVLDAHLDLRDAYAGDEWSHACVCRRALEEGHADRLVVVGARTGSPEEWDRAEADDVTVVSPEETRQWITAMDAGEHELAEVDSVYLSVDIDGADPGYAPGTGTMEPFGLTPREMRDAVRAVAPRSDGFDVVEVNDRDDGQAAALAGKLLREFVYGHAANSR
ncbi:Arginase family enzyme [Halalkaliarchaeum sp. AArc-CO]|uniref:agmatinase n=1 Tax=unclassified Halalkaliarchaeum TaxID=2678344 RepID=UPI00217E2483|nr:MULTISPECIES: agmatinase [unclassified Halalkaliarchaeum]MDR5674721.1 agmatinase [Halalkaliarchaeum sp. AArc-GB]UWG51880.1 Arginase family enzyme [Halalkaliarchaeum sp. AArc-CO]